MSPESVEEGATSVPDGFLSDDPSMELDEDDLILDEDEDDLFLDDEELID